SQYVVKAMSEWIHGWKARGWRRKEGPLLNVELLQALDEISARHRVQWRWVKGHAGDPGNERADALTNDAMDALQRGESPDWERRGTWNR
ncbi:MAG: ribonuclease, partial [Planctomycetota bacterium]